MPVAENVLERQFAPDAPNRMGTGDITYIATAVGWLQLTVVIDLFNQELTHPRPTKCSQIELYVSRRDRDSPCGPSLQHPARAEDP